VRLINDDLRELELKESDLFEVFWSAETEAGYRRLQEHIRQQYKAILNTLNEEEMRVVRAFVASTVVVGAVRGLEFGHALHRRQTHRGRKKQDETRTTKKDASIEIILKHKRVRDLLQKEPTVSMEKICAALDGLDIEIPWKKLADMHVLNSRCWKTHAKAAVVKNTISKARKRVRQVNSDIRYVKAFIRKQRIA
jgi:hypothetical protein